MLVVQLNGGAQGRGETRLGVGGEQSVCWVLGGRGREMLVLGVIFAIVVVTIVWYANDITIVIVTIGDVVVRYISVGC